MSEKGQSRSFWSVLRTSANPPVAELPLRPGQVSVVALCMARSCVARRSSETDERESCNNVLDLYVEHLLRAIMRIRAHPG